MDLKLPLIVSRQGVRALKCWLPHWPDVKGEGVSLSELKDDLALMVMERFEGSSPRHAWKWQVAPHLRLKHVNVDTEARDREDGRVYKLKGRLAVLLEKWPHDVFWVATPTAAPHLAFALAHPEALDAALAARLVEHCLKARIERLDQWHVERDERLDILEVDADAPTVLPRGQAPTRKRRAKVQKKKDGTVEEPQETPDEREQRRSRARLSVRTLRQIGKNLAHQARDGDLGRAFGREGIVSSLVETLEKRESAAIVLLGQGGVGKTAIAHELTRRLVERQAASATRRDVWRIDGNQFIAGMSYVGQWEARARELCAELVDTGDVLFVDDLASLIYAGRHSKGDTNVAQYLEPHLARGEITLVAECTPERFERIREESPSFAALFDVLPIPPMTTAESLPVLLGTVRELEAETSTITPRIPPDVMELVLELSGRFFAHRALPGRAVRLIHQVLAGAGVVEGRVRRYRAQDVYEAVRRETGLPDFILGGAAPKSRAQVVADLSSHVAGQPEAIEAVTDAVLALQLSLQDTEKPLANYLFVGPTGVGKTETAKALARYLFGSSERLVRFDMSELSTPGAIARLVGSPGQPDGELVTALRTQPFCVVLLDEIEKAHPRVFDALLQFLGEGRLSDPHGRMADGRNAVVVMTSNLGVREAASQAGFHRGDTEGAAQHYLAAARQFFRPELFNRLDRVVPFRSLDKSALRKVVEHALAELLSRRGLRRSNVLVDVEPELLELLVDQAFDPRFGARPLKRLLEKKLAVPLAHHLLRRDSDDLAVIELLRQGDEPTLSVRLLSPAEKVAVDELSEWTLPRLRLAGREAAARVQSLLSSARAERLRKARRDALARSTPVPESSALIDSLEVIASRLEELFDLSLDTPAYDEVERRVSKHETQGPFYEPKHGLRAKPKFEGVVYAVNADAVASAATPQLAQILDELELLATQLDATDSPEEIVTLLLEPVGPPSAAAVNAFSGSLPPLGPLVLGERANGAWEEQAPEACRRYAFVYQGARVSQLIEPWLGYARVVVQVDDGTTRRALVRAVALEGGDGTVESARQVLREYDAKTRAEREARRQRGASAIEPEKFPRLVFERESVSAGGHFVATGLEATRQLAHLAACLRRRSTLTLPPERS
ncbi:MAG: AAA family ATPase [Archangium sp.]